MQQIGSALLNFPKAILEAFRGAPVPQEPVLTAEQISELEQNVLVFFATEAKPEFMPANALPVASAWENSEGEAIKSLRRKAAENGREAVYNVTIESRPYYEGGRFFSIYRVYGLI
ncbi:hypothetical protein [Pseudomonas sp. PLMAX]|jgi:hypothetical protein|uniref:hypothetical protein n=1 Tax=Pseudomonas sp. PLMAX TaxID=2201998 RepID=UPI0038BAACD8